MKTSLIGVAAAALVLSGCYYPGPYAYYPPVVPAGAANIETIPPDSPDAQQPGGPQVGGPIDNQGYSQGGQPPQQGQPGQPGPQGQAQQQQPQQQPQGYAGGQPYYAYPAYPYPVYPAYAYPAYGYPAYGYPAYGYGYPAWGGPSIGLGFSFGGRGGHHHH